ncbi:hypothetical protein ACFWMG_18885, partial [Streptomyces sp. NPDC127074]
MSRMVVGDEGALQEMSSFIGDRTLEPDGAVILGCVLQLAAREDSAQFWWQFAAGAGNSTATYCLYLLHLALGEGLAADCWYRQMVADRHTPAPAVHEVLMHRLDLGREGQEPTATVRMAVLPEAVEAVVRYVPTAIEYVDGVELPLPTDGFAGDVHGVPGPGVVEERAELRTLERVEAAGGAAVLLEDDRVLDAGLVQDEVPP